MVNETTPMVLAERRKHTMALDQSALLEVLETLKAAEADDRIRQAAEAIYQALIEAELWIPKLRAGSFFPSLLERRRRAGRYWMG